MLYAPQSSTDVVAALFVNLPRFQNADRNEASALLVLISSASERWTDGTAAFRTFNFVSILGSSLP